MTLQAVQSDFMEDDRGGAVRNRRALTVREVRKEIHIQPSYIHIASYS